MVTGLWAIPPVSATLLNASCTGSMPATLGIGTAVLLTNWTRADRSDHEFSTAAGHQLKYLLDVAPRTSDGAISHRADQVQLW